MKINRYECDIFRKRSYGWIVMQGTRGAASKKNCARSVLTRGSRNLGKEKRMEIVRSDNSKDYIKLGFLLPGRPFMHDGSIYLRTDMDQKAIIGETVKSLRGVDLKTGELVVFDENTPVQFVEAKVVIQS